LDRKIHKVNLNQSRRTGIDRMNVKNQERPLGHTYWEILKARESLETLVVPSEKIETLSGALDSSLKVISDVSLMAAAVESSLTAICKKLDALGEDPTLGERITREFQDLVALRDKILLGFFGDAVSFVRAFERMSRNNLLAQAGIDPNDEAASMAYLVKLGQTVSAESNPGN
jgi:hypothetical protein